MAQDSNHQVRRDRVTAVHSIDGFALSVPDLAQARAYFEAFGLDVRDEADSIGLYTDGANHRWASIHASGRPKRLEYISFGAYVEDLPVLERRARDQGVEFVDVHPRSDGQGMWMCDPDGVLLRIVAAPKVTPSQAAQILPAPMLKNAIGVPVAPPRSKGGRVRPQRLSHLLLFCSDVPRSKQFYEQVLGLRLSDSSLDLIAFMHGAHASDHHLLALVKSEGPGLHHSSWIVNNVDEIGLGMEQMFAAGHTQGWGVGRHVIGSNYFYYVRDPWGSFTEYSCGIDFIGADIEWPAADHPPEDSFYLWGPSVPDYFTVNHELAK